MRDHINTNSVPDEFWELSFGQQVVIIAVLIVWSPFLILLARGIEDMQGEK